MTLLAPEWRTALLESVIIHTRDEVYARLAAQGHRRVIKTHLPLNEIPCHSQVKYVVIARHPLDATSCSCGPSAFFRRGTSGAGRELLTSAELARYHAHAARFAPADMLTWLHGGRP